MIDGKSTGAVTARKALEADRFVRRVAIKNELPQNRSQYPIYDDSCGSDRSAAEGISACGYTPALGLHRASIEAGHDSDRVLHAHRDGIFTPFVRSISEGACLTVEDYRHGRLRRWRKRRAWARILKKMRS
jgi:hypothetical protein